MPTIDWDVESRSAADIKKVSARRYASDPTTEVLCICYSVDGGPIEHFIPEAGKPAPEVFYEAARDPAWTIASHNSAFEDAITEYVLMPRFNWPWIPIERHICTMALARYHGLPGRLDKVAKLLDLPVQKDREGARLMLQLCKPRKPRKGEDPTQIYWVEVTPEKLARLIQYCKVDVAVEREIPRRLSALPTEEQRVWMLDHGINARGFCADLDFAGAASQLVQAEKAHINEAIATLTGGAVTGFTKIKDMLAFINGRGHGATSLDAKAVTAMLEDDIDDTVRRLLELRQQGANSGAAKYAGLSKATFPDRRIRGLLTYYGAHTGRWTSSGFNVHNLPREDSGDALAAVSRGDLEAVRSFGPPIEVMARLARAVVTAPAGRRLIAGDFSVLEPRVASWFSEETWKLDTFREFDRTGDPMLDAHRVVGAQMEGKPVDPTDDALRQRGKTCHMALNYGGGARVWRKFVPNDPRSDAEIKVLEIEKFRQLHPKQTRLMYELEAQALQCVHRGKPVVGKRHSFEMDGDNLILRLPSGRPLFYPKAQIKPGKFNGYAVTYHNPAKDREDAMWYGAWFAHLVSATSRDLLVNALFKLDDAGFEIVLHVHDEAVAEIDAGCAAAAHDRFKACMLDAPAWAEGLPLAAKIRSGLRYLKGDARVVRAAETEVTPPAIERASAPMSDKFRPAWWLTLKQLGYDVIPLFAKDRPYKGWPAMTNNEAAIKGWNGAGAAVRMKGSDLLVIDLDIHVAAARDQMLSWMLEHHPEFMAGCLQRHSERISIALIGRCATAKGTQKTSRYVGEGTDPKGDFVEVFTGNSKKYVGVVGRHSPGRAYDYAGRHIIETPVDQLPWLPDREIALMLAAFEEIMAGLGWEKVVLVIGKDAVGSKVYDLLPDQIFTLADETKLPLRELEELALEVMANCEQPLKGYADLWDPDTGHGKFSSTRVLVTYGREGLCLFDTKYEVRHRWASAAPQADMLGEKFRELMKTVDLPWRVQS